MRPDEEHLETRILRCWRCEHVTPVWIYTRTETCTCPSCRAGTYIDWERGRVFRPRFLEHPDGYHVIGLEEISGEHFELVEDDTEGVTNEESNADSDTDSELASERGTSAGDWLQDPRGELAKHGAIDGRRGEPDDR